MMRKIILIGNGGHSKVIKDIIEAQQQFEVVGFLDDKYDSYFENKGYFYDSFQNIDLYKSDYLFNIAIGNNFVREKIYREMEVNIEQFPVLIHPTACISPSVSIGNGTVVMPSTVINAETVIGMHSIVNSGAIVEHDNEISDFVHLSPNATLAGNVTIGKYSHVAVNATILPQITIGEKCIVGASATVVNDINSDTTVIGTPAKPKE
ncbi:acetyltransferase [Staphylococcus caeli]|uniref:acetyltransferase n=1 Tax=Staphylococcus caeli TaxID=2201815 RepID=UPI003F55C20C